MIQHCCWYFYYSCTLCPNKNTVTIVHLLLREKSQEQWTKQQKWLCIPEFLVNDEKLINNNKATLCWRVPKRRGSTVRHALRKTRSDCRQVQNFLSYENNANFLQFMPFHPHFRKNNTFFLTQKWLLIKLVLSKHFKHTNIKYKIPTVSFQNIYDKKKGKRTNCQST